MFRIPLRFLVSCLATFAPLSASAVEPVRIIATGGRIGHTFYTHPLASTAFRQRTPHKLGGPVAEMQIGFMDWMYPTSEAETSNADNDVTIDHAWLERAATGQILPLTFGGSRQLILPKNGTEPYYLSDAIPSSAWTGAAPARDEVFWLHVKGNIPPNQTSTATSKTPVGTPASFSGAKFITYPPANDPGTFDTAGAVPTITGQGARPAGLPLIFLGRFTGPGHLAVMGIGDSILDGTGDPANPVPVISGYGFFNRAALDANGANTIATFNLTRHGQTAFSWITPTRQQRQTHFLKFANVVVEEYGTNDLGQNGTGDPALILQRVEGIWTAARNAGVQKIVRTLLMPRTTSVGNTWNNLEGQTPNTGWAAGGKRDTINTGLIAARAAGKVDVLMDTLAAVADPTDPNRWLTNGTAKYTTSDGTHVSPTGNILLAAPLRAALLSLTVDSSGGMDYAAWAATVDWQGKDSTPDGDANGDGVSNRLSFAMALSPLANPPAGTLPTTVLDTTTTGGPWLAFTYRENLKAGGLTYTVETSGDLAKWGAVTPDGATAIAETVSPDVDGTGTVALRRVRVKQAAGEKVRFARLRVTP